MDTPRPRPGHRSEYRFFHPLTTRWSDNGVFGHINNAAYYGFFDAALTGWLLCRGLLGLTSGPMWMVAETGCRIFTEAAFPENLAIGLRVARIGTSSVRWELAVFREGREDASAEGHLIHVHVARETRRPAPIPDGPRTAIAAMLR